MRVKQSKHKKEEVVDLATLIKQERRLSQSDHQNTHIDPSQTSYKQQLEKDYHTSNTNYTSQYSSTNKNTKNARSYRKQINFVPYQQSPKQFIAYIVVSKQSALGVLNPQRLLVFDSMSKQLKYFNEIPEFPIQHVHFTEDSPMENVQIDRVTKFVFKPVKNSVGQVLVSWNQFGSKKQWNLKMGSYKVASDFASIICQVRSNQHLKQKSTEKAKPNNIQVQRKIKINKQATPFISQIKKFDQQQKLKNESRVKSIINQYQLDSHLIKDPKNVQEHQIQASIPGKQSLESQQIIKNMTGQLSINNQKIIDNQLNDNDKRQANNFQDNKQQIDIVDNQSFEKQNRCQQSDLSNQKAKKIINDSSIRFIDSNVFEKSIEHYNQSIAQQSSNKQQTLTTNPKKQQQLNNNNIDVNINVQNKAQKLQKAQKQQNFWLKQDRAFKNSNRNSNISHKVSNIVHDVQDQGQKSEFKQLKIEDIIKSAHQQFQNKNKQPFQQNQNERMSYLQSILNNRKSAQKDQTKRQKSNSISQSKVIIKKYDTPKTPSKDLYVDLTKDGKSDRKNTNKNNKKEKIGYSQRYESYRESLLAQRQRNNPVHKVINLNNKNLSKRQSTIKSHNDRYSSVSKRYSASTNKQTMINDEQKQKWFLNWMNCSNQHQYAEVYYNFYNQCVNKVKRITSKYSQWYLTHKNGDQFIIQENNIQYKYFLFTKDNENSTHHRQDNELFKIKNYDYLFKFIKRSFSSTNTNISNIKVMIPLTCILDYKGLKVFCKAMINEEIKLKTVQILKDYIPIIRQLQQNMKISLFKCQLFEVSYQDQIALYIEELNSLPKLQIRQNQQLFVDPTYIQQYIVSGIISNDNDLNEINKHLQSKIYRMTLKHLNQSYLLSSVELMNILHTYGLNKSYLSILYQRSLSQEFSHAKTIIFESIVAQCLKISLREYIHIKIINKKVQNSLQQCFMNVLNRWINRDNQLFEKVQNKVKKMMHRQELISGINFKQFNFNNSYILSSLFVSLGINCDFKYKMKSADFQDLQKDALTGFNFDQKQINLHFSIHRTIYDYKHFNQSKILYNSIFNGAFIKNHQAIDKQAIFSELNHNKSYPQNSSYLFKLLPVQYKILVNYYLSHTVQPNQNMKKHSFENQFQNLYFNLYKHSTSIIINHNHFLHDFLGLKWLIKLKRFAQADVKFRQMRERVYTWAKKCPKIVMDFNDLYALYSMRQGKFQSAIEMSLVSLKTAIHYFGYYRQQKWQIIWQKAFYAGNIHFKINKFQQAYRYYQLCTDLIQKIDQISMANIQISQQFLQVYNKKALIQIFLGNMKQASQILHQNIQLFSKWKGIFSKNSLKINLIKKIMKQQYKLYCMTFNICQQQKNRKLYLQNLIVFIEKYLQKDMKPILKNKVNPEDIDQLKDVIRYLWTYINMDLQTINCYLSSASRNIININFVQRFFKELYRQNNNKYVYTSEEMYRFIHQWLALKKQDFSFSQQIQQIHKKTLGQSVLLAAIIDTLGKVSNVNKNAKKYRLYDQDSKFDDFFVLEAIVNIIGYEYSVGTIESFNHTCCFEI